MNNQNNSVSNSDIYLPENNELNFAVSQVEAFISTMRNVVSNVSLFNSEGLDLNGIENEINGIKNNIDNLLQNDSVIIESYNSLRQVASLLDELMVDDSTTFIDNTEKEKNGFWSWLGNTAKRTGATIIEADTAIISGVLKVGEHLVDGAAWAYGKVFRYDTSDFIAMDLVGTANDLFYDATPVGIFLDENSYFTHDGKVMQTFQDISTQGTELVVATAATIATGGVASPFVAATLPISLGFISGTGEAAEKKYSTMDNPSIDDGTASILLHGLGESIQWYAKGKLGEAILNTGAIINGNPNSGNIARSEINSVTNKFRSGTAERVLSQTRGERIRSTLFNRYNFVDSLGNLADFTADGIDTGVYSLDELALQTALIYGGGMITSGYDSLIGKRIWNLDITPHIINTINDFTQDMIDNNIN